MYIPDYIDTPFRNRLTSYSDLEGISHLIPRNNYRKPIYAMAIYAAPNFIQMQYLMFHHIRRSFLMNGAKIKLKQIKIKPWKTRL